MPDHLINYILMVITFVYASALFCDLYFKTKSSKAKFSLLFLPLSIILLSAGFLLELSTDGIFIYTLLSSLFIYTGLCFIGYSWLVFSVCISSENKQKVSGINAIALIPPVLIILLIVTNPLHDLLYIKPYDSGEMRFNAEYLFILALGGVYVLLANIILIIRFLINTAFSFKLRIAFPAVLVFMPISFYFRIFYFRHFELVPFFLLIGYHLILYNVSVNYKLFDIVPRSIASIVQNMDQPILIANRRNIVVNFNGSFMSNFGSVTSIKETDPLELFVEKLGQSTVLDGENQNILDSMLLDIDKNVLGNIHVYTPYDKWYFVLIQNVLNSKGRKIGKLISFNDITTIHDLNQKLKQKNCELEKINMELKNANEKILKHTLMAEELAITRERSRILSELHDTIGQAYTSNLALARCTNAFLLSNRREKALDVLEEMACTTKQLLFNITSSVNDKDTLIQQQPLKDILNKLFKSYRKSGIDIQLKLYTDVEVLEYKIRHNIYRICQESINNSLKHGMAQNIYISIEEESEKIILEIADDGAGCDLVYKGIGLKGIEYRISEIDGEVSFISDKSRQKGFIVRAEIPIRRESKR
ncbi:MAG TPA: histidine kinase N-terminal 7TM domain-containing protein [Pseudobacteroides sp.]|uniref:sensor histidine kinase n=1 Tax=Pseudobacteroides sp. TaxID=1968840 RepID=UPI002F92E0B7